MLPDSLYAPLAVVALSIFAMMLAGFYQKYEADQTMRRTLAKKEITLIDEIEQLLKGISKLPLSYELRHMLRVEMVTRYTKVTDIYPKHPNLSMLMLHSGERMKAEPKQNVPSPKIESSKELNILILNIYALINFFNENNIRQKLSPGKIPDFVQELGETRAKMSFKYYSEKADEKYQEGDEYGARQLAGELSSILHTKGPNTELVKELFQDTEALIKKFRTQPQEENGSNENETAVTKT